MGESPTFVYLLRPVRADFVATMTRDEQRIVDEHFDYLKKLCDDGKLVLAGPCLDAAFGVVIFRAESEGAARPIMESDPAIVRGVMTAELHAFHVSLMGRA